MIEWLAIKELLASGGFLMIPLILVGVLLWYLVAMRFFRLRELEQNCLKAETNLVQAAKAGLYQLFAVEIVWTEKRNMLQRHRAMINTLIASAPLLGLLGTVSGMIVTFDGITTMSFFSQHGGIASGISEALSTTQMGLAIALPGLLVEQLLDRKANRLDHELDELMIKLSSHRQNLEAKA